MAVLKGIAASHGVVEGTVRVTDEHGRVAIFNEGDILVAKVTEPSMIIMMNKAAAFVTDLGGIMGHAAIVARELAVPCVVATRTATQVLKDGMRVRVDGTQGEVTVLEQLWSTRIRRGLTNMRVQSIRRFHT